MEIIPKFEIGTFKGKVAGYNEYRFICRLFIPPNRDEATVVWLREKEALVLSTSFEKPYSKIIFATNNDKIIRSIHHKYGISKVDLKLLYTEIDAFDEKSEDDFEEFYSSTEYQAYDDEYYQDTQREILDYMTDYSNAMVASSENGWFYDETIHSKNEALKLALEEDLY
ncbi:hypothetical protein XM38_027740 [Halomicronema hongdechloris C2206]|uniref:Uncharacterized protein n=1 Tax=Halomicronema hongdechloris C2206 TaxID=1641165 RepID=A0A1Z3HNG4_9CYAN|nr:hypothetical protein [Halomicronema hongdechloris]ASC71820.1 hypothetical protein XM38_027740 [Halomicronema hongdechloris C2206]